MAELIAALDEPDFVSAAKLVSALGDTVSYYKVGMELYYSVGGEIISYLSDMGKKIFLDLKLHDIPNTVASGLRSLMRPGVTMMNVHASGGFTMMAQAAESVRARADALGTAAPKLVAVTVLTSISEEAWLEMGCGQKISDQVLRLAALAKRAGLDGVVASPREAAAIRAECGENFLIVTPGIRMASDGADDQSRIAAPSAAVENGATHLVVGRPIRAAKDPKAAAEKILMEMNQSDRRGN